MVNPSARCRSGRLMKRRTGGIPAACVLFGIALRRRQGRGESASPRCATPPLLTATRRAQRPTTHPPTITPASGNLRCHFYFPRPPGFSSQARWRKRQGSDLAAATRCARRARRGRSRARQPSRHEAAPHHPAHRASAAHRPGRRHAPAAGAADHRHRNPTPPSNLAHTHPPTHPNPPPPHVPTTNAPSIPRAHTRTRTHTHTHRPRYSTLQH